MKILSYFLALATLSLVACTDTTSDPYAGRLGKNGTSNNMGAGPGNAYGNMTGMTGSPRTTTYSQ